MTTAKLYVIVTKQQMSTHGCAISFQRACERKGIEYIRLISDEICLSDVAELDLTPGSLLYRISTGEKAQTLESIIMTERPGQFTTIYESRERLLPSRMYQEHNEQTTAGLPVIPTIIMDELWAQFDTTELTRRIDTIGGFPVVVKTLGLSHGAGVQKFDTAEDLQAMLKTKQWQNSPTVARKYLANYRHFRLIVVDNQVVAAIEYHKPQDDFRTNAQETPDVRGVAVEQLPKELIDIALQSTKLRGSLLSGVDILVDQTDNTPYLAEVNVPCYFTRAEEPTGIDIAGTIIDALLRKREADTERANKLSTD